MIATVVPNHKEMASALKAAAGLLSNVHVLSPEGVSSLNAAAARLFQCPGKSWFCQTTKAEPIQFEKCKDRSERAFTPKIGVDRIEVRDEADALPFAKWDISLILEYEDDAVHCPRWHFDLGNPDQDGPVTHLQYGGNKHPSNAGLDVRVREPRWNTAPMDIILLCETVAANFFPKEWNSALRHDPQWAKLVKQSQKLCYPYYLRALYDSLNTSDKPTHLDTCWNTGSTS